jgi:hypothetical protein
MEAAVTNAHGNSEWLGGNAFGINQNPTIPAGTDYIAVQGTNFKINLAAVKKLSERLPVFFHLGNSPADPKSDGCVFMKEYNTRKRKAYVRERAKQQATYGFRLAYPVYFPECIRRKGKPGSQVFSYNAPRDGSMMGTILELMGQYD